MKITDLTLEKFTETANLMKQLHLPLVVVEMAKELGVKRTELMQFINEHSKNINTKNRSVGKRGHETEVLYVSGIYLNPHENPLTEEYAEDRWKEHRIKLYKVEDYGYICGFALMPYDPEHDWHSCEAWENQKDDVKAFLEIPEVKDKIGFAKGGFGDGWTDYQENAFRQDDAEAVLKAALAKGLRIFVYGIGEVKTVEEMFKKRGMTMIDTSFMELKDKAGMYYGIRETDIKGLVKCVRGGFFFPVDCSVEKDDGTFCKIRLYACKTSFGKRIYYVPGTRMFLDDTHVEILEIRSLLSEDTLEVAVEDFMKCIRALVELGHDDNDIFESIGVPAKFRESLKEALGHLRDFEKEFQEYKKRFWEV